MMTRHSIEKSCVAASIMCVKYERLGQNYVTLHEVNIITQKIQEEFNKKFIDARINDYINTDYFNIQDGIILLNDYTLQDIYHKYSFGVGDAMVNAILMIWNRDFIIKNLLEIRKKELESLSESISIYKSTNKVLTKTQRK